MKMKINITFLILLSLFFFNGCARSYNVQLFSFPPETKPHESGWIYLGQIVSWDPFGKKSTDKGKREIEINITDKNKKAILQDKLQIDCATLEGNIHWDKFEMLTIELNETGNPYSEDEYNKNLTKEGPRHLVTLSYVWNGSEFIKN